MSRPVHLVVFALCMGLSVAVGGCSEESLGCAAKSEAPDGVPFDDVVRVEAGYKETCVVVASGTLYCAGGLRGGINPDVSMARPIEGAERTIDLSLGNPSCAVQQEGTVLCWGAGGGSDDAPTPLNYSLPKGTGRWEPVEIPGLRGIERVVMGTMLWPGWAFAHGEPPVWQWGQARAGRFVPPTPAEQLELRDVVQTTAGRAYCARQDSGAVTCWEHGGLLSGEEGHITLLETPSFAPAPATDVAASSRTDVNDVCALDELERAVCWRYDLETRAVQPLEHPFSSAQRWKDIDLGKGHGCGVKPDGSVWCHGLNDFGQLGVPKPMYSEELVRVPGVSDAKAVATGRQHSCAMLRAGSVMCWGRNEYGPCGTAERGERAEPSAFLRYVGADKAPY